MSDREVVVRIVGKNLTHAEVEAAVKDFYRLRDAARDAGREGPALVRQWGDVPPGLKKVETASDLAARELERINKVAAGFSGDRLINDANDIVAAVNQIGGASKLTRDEQAAINRTLDAAIEKYSALGRKAPADMEALHQATKHQSQQVGFLEAQVQKLGPAVVAGFSVAAVVGAIEKVGAYASGIQNVAERLKISAERVQQFDAVAKRNGDTIDDIAASIRFMSGQLVEGNDEARRAAEKLGLTIQDLRLMSPDQALLAISEAALKIKDPFQQVWAGSQLLGKGFEALRPTLKALPEEMDGVKVLSNELVAQGNKLDATWTDLKTSGTQLMAGVLIPLEPLVSAAAFGINELADGWIRYLDAINRAVTTQPPRPQPAPGTVGSPFGDAKVGGTGSIAEVAIEQLIEGVLQAAPNLPRSAALAVVRFTNPEAFKDVEEELRRSAEVLIEYHQQLKKTRDEIFGADAIRRAQTLVEVLQGIGSVTGFTRDKQRELNAILHAGLEAYRATGREAPKGMEAIWFQLERLAPTFRDVTAQMPEFWSAFSPDARLDKGEKAWEAYFGGLQTLQDEWALATSNGITQREREIEIALRRELRMYREQLGGHADLYNEIESLVRRKYQQMADAAHGFGQGSFRVLEGIKVKTKAEMEEAAFFVEQQLRDMEASGQFTEQALRKVREELRRLKEEAAGGVSFGRASLEGLTESLQMIPGIIAKGIIHGTDWQDIGAAIASDLGAKLGAAIGTKLGKALGEEIGSAIGGAVGGAIGSLIGLAVSALGRRGWQDVMRRVGYDWGVDLSEGLAKAIADQAKLRFDNNRQAAEIFNLNSILGEAGGLTTDNLPTFQQKLRDLFSMIETGTFTAAEGVAVLDDNFQAFADFFTQDGGLISPQLREMLALTERFGLASSNVRQFLQGQADVASGGFAAIAAGARSGGVDQAEIDRLGRLGMAAVSAQLESGTPLLEVLREMGPAIDVVLGLTNDFHLAQTTAFGDITHLRTFFAANEELAGSIDGTTQMLEALYNSNLLTQESFADLGAIAVGQFNEMTANGLTHDQALRAQQQTLQTLWEIWQEGQLTVDDQTRALLENAETAGVVGRQHMDAQDRIVRAVERVADLLEDTFGRVFPQAVGAGARAAEDALQTFIRRDWRVRVGVEYEYSDPPPPPRDDADTMHYGGLVRAHRGMFLAPDERLIIGQTNEYMVSRRGVAAVGVGFLDQINAGMRPAGVGGTQNFFFIDGGGGARQVSRSELTYDQLQFVARAMKHGQLVAS